MVSGIGMEQKLQVLSAGGHSASRDVIRCHVVVVRPTFELLVRVRTVVSKALVKDGTNPLRKHERLPAGSVTLALQYHIHPSVDGLAVRTGAQQQVAKPHRQLIWVSNIIL